jgi:DNA modification methylase
MVLDPRIKKIKIDGHRNTRTISCPYCQTVHRVTLVNHLRRNHPDKWDEWGNEFVRLYNETNDLKRVMRSFANAQGKLILSWTVIDREIKRKVESERQAPVFLRKHSVARWIPDEREYARFPTTVWDVPRRGTWAVHQSNYRGNWAPQVPRALLEMYSQPGDLVLDPFVGGGTTLIEAFLLGRHAIGCDVSDFALQMSRARITELRTRARRETISLNSDVRISIRRGDARTLTGIQRNSVDFICTHPPYGDALQYSHDDPADLSRVRDPALFLTELGRAARRFYEVLKPGKFCAILIGDLRREGQLYTLGIDTVSSA